MAEAQPTQYSRGERTVLFLDSNDGIHEATIGGVLSFGLGIGAGFATYHGVKEIAFPGNDQYEAVTSEINEAEWNASSLYNSEDALSREGFNEAAADVHDRADEYSATAEDLRGGLPSGYNPNVEGAFSVTSAIAVGAVVFYGLARKIGKKAHDIKVRHSVVEPAETSVLRSGSEA